MVDVTIPELLEEQIKNTSKLIFDNDSNITKRDTLNGFIDRTLHSGIRNGLEISINGDPTKFDVALGNLLLIDNNPDPTNNTVTNIPFVEQTGILDTNLAAQVSHVLMSDTGVITTSLFPPQTIAEAFNQGYLGSLLHFGGVIIDVVQIKIVAHGSTPTEILELLFNGSTKIDGSVVTGNSDLTVNVTPGILKQLGPGFTPGQDNNAPNVVVTSALSPVPVGKFLLLHLDGVGDVVVDGASNVLKPSLFNEGGLGTLVTVSPANNFTTIRVFQLGIDDGLLFYYGTEKFATIIEAQMAPEPTWVESVTTKISSPVAKIHIQSSTTDIAAGIIAGTVIIEDISIRPQLH